MPMLDTVIIGYEGLLLCPVSEEHYFRLLNNKIEMSNLRFATVNFATTWFDDVPARSKNCQIRWLLHPYVIEMRVKKEENKITAKVVVLPRGQPPPGQTISIKYFQSIWSIIFCCTALHPPKMAHGKSGLFFVPRGCCCWCIKWGPIAEQVQWRDSERNRS